MIRIDEMTRGRFGNRILHYNSLVQLANMMGVEPSCSPWEGYDCFHNLVKHKESTNYETTLSWKDILESDISSLPKENDYVVGSYCLHNTFWELTKNDPREFIQVNERYKRNLPTDKVNVGIHLRGDDVLGRDGNNGREIHFPDYYMKAIDLVENHFNNTKYYVCTDDLRFMSYISTIDYLNNEELEYELGSPDHFKDFSTLSECDVLICSSSTFVVCAGFVGKENKKIIHSQDWIDKNLHHTPWHLTEDPENVRTWQLSFDNFWVELYNGGNEFYKVWKFV